MGEEGQHGLRGGNGGAEEDGGVWWEQSSRSSRSRRRSWSGEARRPASPSPI